MVVPERLRHVLAMRRAPKGPSASQPGRRDLDRHRCLHRRRHGTWLAAMAASAAHGRWRSAKGVRGIKVNAQG